MAIVTTTETAEAITINGPAKLDHHGERLY
jgi:hypothetical protein